MSQKKSTDRVEPRNVPIAVGDEVIEPGSSRTFELNVGRLPTGSWLSLPIRVVNGRYAGPNIWLSGAIHGDEIIGVEIVRRVMRRIQSRRLRGAIIAVPIVNVFGFIGESRYMPDRRDLNRSFPGSKRGSLAARLARLFMSEVVAHCDVGIDLHTAAGHRVNLPQVRGNLDDAWTLELAEAFGAPFMINARLRDGSLREAATKIGKRVLLYEAGQIQRFDEHSITLGVEGVLRTMEAMGMGRWNTQPASTPMAIDKTTWVRSRRGGVAVIDVGLHDHVAKGTVLATVTDAFGARPSKVRAPVSGWVIAHTQNPLVSPGDALVHLAVPGVEGRDELPVAHHRPPGPEAERRRR